MCSGCWGLLLIAFFGTAKRQCEGDTINDVFWRGLSEPLLTQWRAPVVLPWYCGFSTVMGYAFSDVRGQSMLGRTS